MKWCYKYTTVVRPSASLTCSIAGGLSYSSAVVYINIYLDKFLILGAVFTRNFYPGVEPCLMFPVRQVLPQKMNRGIRWSGDVKNYIGPCLLAYSPSQSRLPTDSIQKNLSP